MGLIDQAFKTLAAGVSQQEGPIRLPNYLKAQVNMVPDPVEGLRSRNGTMLEAVLLDDSAATTLEWDDHNPAVHFIDRDPSLHFAVVIGQGGIKVYDILTGDEKTVATPDGTDYLDGTNFAVETINDYTFIVNKDVVVEKSADAGDFSDDWIYKGTIWIKTGAIYTSYTVRVATPWSATPSFSDYTYNQASSTAGTDQNSYIGAQLKAVLDASLSATWTFTQSAEVLVAEVNSGANFNIEANDTRGSGMCVAVKDTASDEGDLPPRTFDGHVVRVIGDKGSDKDDYYVKFTAEGGGIGRGYWSECPKPNIELAFDASTMPHVLVRESDGTFTFRQADWGTREAGDDDSSPFPSFTGNTISAITAHVGRLWLTSGAHVVGSRAGDVFHFFRSTAQATLDGDPIDIDILATKVIDVTAILPWNKHIAAFSQGRQTLLRGGEIMSPDNVSSQTLSEYDCRPSEGAGAADDRLFVMYAQSDDHLGMLDFAAPLFDSEKVLVATSVTDHVPTYIKGNPKGLAVTSEALTAVVRTDDDYSTIYVYKWKVERGERAQTAWFQFTTPGRQVLGCAFYASRLYLVTRSTSTAEIYLEYMEMSAGAVLGALDFVPMLDMMTAFEAADGVLQSGTTYRVTVPFTVPTGTTLAALDAANGTVIPKLAQGSNYIDLTGPLPDDFYVGLVPDWRFDISPIWYRRPAQAGGIETIPGQRLQVLRGALTFSRSGEFRAHTLVTPANAPTQPTRSLTVNPRPSTGELVPKTGTISFGVNGQNTETEIWFTGSGPHPVRATGFRWLGDLELIAQPA